MEISKPRNVRPGLGSPVWAGRAGESSERFTLRRLMRLAQEHGETARVMELQSQLRALESNDNEGLAFEAPVPSKPVGGVGLKGFVNGKPGDGWGSTVWPLILLFQEYPEGLPFGGLLQATGWSAGRLSGGLRRGQASGYIDSTGWCWPPIGRRSRLYRGTSRAVDAAQVLGERGLTIMWRAEVLWLSEQ